MATTLEKQHDEVVDSYRCALSTGILNATVLPNSTLDRTYELRTQQRVLPSLSPITTIEGLISVYIRVGIWGFSSLGTLIVWLNVTE